MIEARQARYGSLECVVVDGSPSPSIAAVLCHGYGASGMDLAGLSAEWIRLIGDGAAKFRFVFPEAPHTLEELGMPDGHAWWPINMARLMQLVEADQFDQLHTEHPPGIEKATEEICACLSEVKDELDGESTPLALGGFSQGAMLTMNASLLGDIPPPQLLFQFSGTTICEATWQAHLTRLSQTKVFQSHGTIDPMLPFASAKRLHEVLVSGGVDAEFHSFHGPHTIDPESVVITAQRLATLAG